MHLLFICTETAVVEAYKFISKVEIETFFLVFLLFKQVREEGTLNRGGRSFEIMANGVGAYLGEDARLERGRLFEEIQYIERLH